MNPTIPVSELTDKELDAVSGGSVFTLSAINQQNWSTQTAAAVNAVTALSAATVAQAAVQTNSII
jgi:bacteriocin-like protein